MSLEMEKNNIRIVRVFFQYPADYNGNSTYIQFTSSLEATVAFITFIWSLIGMHNMHVILWEKIKGIYSLLFHYFWSALEIRYVLSYWMNFWIVDHICRIGRDVDRCVYAHVSANEKNIKKCSNSSGSWIFSYIRSFHSKFWMLCHIHCNDMFVHLLDYPRDDYSNFRSRRFLICH